MTEHPVLGDRYRLQEVIGRGGMAEVWRAEDVRLHRLVAIKRLRVDLASDPTFQARFRREAKSAAGLNHPNIVSVFDTGEQDDPKSTVEIPYIVMELVQGHTLRDVLRDGRRIVPEKALEFTQGVLDALAYSHRSGIIHRDIKPANVMLTPSGQVKVMDFGIARAVADTAATMTQTAAVIGTAQYLSPEQARGETVDNRSDIYSAGCLLYELLVGRPPFQGDSPVSVAYQHVREAPTPPSEVDPEMTPAIDAVVLKALAKNPDDRYQTAGEMRDDISRLLAGEPVTAVVPAALVVPEENLATRVAPAAAPPVPMAPPAYAGPPTGAVPVYDEPEKPRRGGLIVLGVLLLALLLAIGFGAYQLLRPDHAATTTPTATSATPVTVNVPALIGMNQNAATSELTNRGLKLGKVTKVNGKDDDTKNTVVAQSVPAGQAVAKDTAIDITINVGPEQVTIPEVTGKPVAEATKALTDLGLKVVTKEDDPQTENPSAKAGEVTGQSPEKDSPAAKGDTVTLTVATGRSIVPNVMGKTTAEAKQILADKGFTNVKVVEQESTSTPGEVIKQNPTDGQERARTDAITLTVAVAPPTPTVTPSPTDTATATSAAPTSPSASPTP